MAHRHDLRPASGRLAQSGSLVRQPRRPDPRPGRSRVCLSRLLPALTLLLGGLSLFAAGLAEAQTYSTKIRNLQLRRARI